MGGLLAQIISLGLVGAIMPTRIIIAILLLTSTKPLKNGLAYLSGLGGLTLAAGLLMLVLFERVQGTSLKDSTVGATVQVVAGSLFLGLGVRSLLDTRDPDAPSPRWMQHIKTISTAGAFLLGLILALGLKLLMILLSAATIIVNAHVSVGQQIAALCILTTVILLGVIIPVGFYATNREHASAWLGRLLGWLEAHNRAITLALSFALGAIFLLNGMSVLTGANGLR